jgi:hypothetical protein
MEPVKLPAGYLLPKGKSMAEVMAIDMELLAAEGIDPKSVRSAHGSDGRDSHRAPEGESSD